MPAILASGARGRAALFSLLVLLVLSLSCSGDAPTATEPPPPPVALGMDVEYAGALAKGGAREHVIPTLAGNLHRIYFQAQSGSASDSLVLTVRADSLGPIVGTLTSVGTQATIAERELRIAPTAAAVRYFLTVSGATADDAGAYRVLVRAPGTQPEHAPANLVLGALLTERLDAEGDVDRFVLQVDSGAEYTVALGVETTRSDKKITLEVNDGLGGFGAQLAWITLPWVAGQPEQRVQRFRFTRTMSLLIIVSGFGASGNYQPSGIVPGGYSLIVHKVDPRPETADSLIAVGDTVFEWIDPVGDEDNFRFSASAGETIRVDLAVTRGLSAGIVAGVGGPVPGQQLRVLTSAASRTDAEGWTLTAQRDGEFILRFRGGLDAPRDSLTARYRIELRHPVPRPEVVGETLSIGDTITAEAIERSADSDEFVVPMPVGSLGTVLVKATPGNVGPLSVRLNDASSSIEIRGDEGPLRRWIRPMSDGLARIRVAGIESTVGGYRIELDSINQEPEVVQSTLPLGVWVGGETSSPLLDIDTFRFQMIGGKRYNVLIGLDSGSTGDPVMWVQNPGVPPTYPSNGGASGTFGVAVTGTALLTVSGPVTGSYRLKAYAIDSMPETVKRHWAVGDTVVGESIDLPGDVDEFTFDGVAGDRVQFSVVEAGEYAERALMLALFEPGTGKIVMSTNKDLGPAIHTLATTGTYTLRILSGPETNVRSVGAYRALMVRLP